MDAKFIHIDKIVDLARYDDEKGNYQRSLKENKKTIKKRARKIGGIYVFFTETKNELQE